MVSSNAKRSDSANSSASYPVCLAWSAPAPQSRPSWWWAGYPGVPEGAVQDIEHLVVQARPHGVKFGCHIPHGLPFPHRRQLVPDNLGLPANAAARACLPARPLLAGRCRKTPDAFARLQSSPALPARLPECRLPPCPSARTLSNDATRRSCQDLAQILCWLWQHRGGMLYPDGIRRNYNRIREKPR